jgi:hypothetical protein
MVVAYYGFVWVYGLFSWKGMIRSAGCPPAVVVVVLPIDPRIVYTSLWLGPTKEAGSHG